MLRRFLNHPYRLFFSLLLPMLLLALAPFFSLMLGIHSPQPLQRHAFLFLNGFAGLAFAGFLYTALPAWTEALRPWPHSLLSLLLLLSLPWRPAAAVLFWLHLAGCGACSAWRARQWGLYFVPLSLFLLALLNALYLWQPRGLHLQSMLEVMLLAELHVLFRVSMVLGNEALAGQENLRFVANPVERNVNVLAVLIYLLAQYGSASPAVLAWLAAAVAASFLARLRDWHHPLLWRQSYIRFLYFLYWSCALSYLAQAWAHVSQPSWYLPARHLLALTAVVAAIAFIVSIVGLRHSQGVPFRIHRSTRLAWSLCLAAAWLRSLGFYLHPHALTLYILPSLLLCLAFVLYLWHYWPIFYRHPPQ